MNSKVRKILLSIIGKYYGGSIFLFFYRLPLIRSAFLRVKVGAGICSYSVFQKLFVYGYLPSLSSDDQLKEVRKILDVVSSRAEPQFARLLLGLGDDLKFDLSELYSSHEMEQYYSKNIFFLMRHVKRLRKKGDITESMRLIENSIISSAVPSVYRMIRGQYNLFSKGLDAIDVRDVSAGAACNEVVYLLHNTLPYNSGGYATRSHGLVKGVLDRGICIKPSSRLGYPEDRGIVREAITDTDIVDGVTYLRFNIDKGYGKIPLDRYLSAYVNAVVARFTDSPPKVFHGASNYMNGAAAVLAAEKLGVKSVYEVRGLWELTRISREPQWESTEVYRLLYEMEAEVAQRADHVITITNALKNEMIRRGVAGEKITVVPNGVNVARFSEAKCDPKDLINKYALEGKSVLSFIGSFAKYEGLPLLISAMENIVSRRCDIVLLLVGDGEVYDEVCSLVDEKGLLNSVIVTGRVPHEVVEEYYAITDIAVYPRYPVPVAEKVSPIKPFESMASGKTVLISDVEAMAEFIEEGINGFTFKKGNLNSLVEKIEYLVDNVDIRHGLNETAKQWVAEHRDWSVITATVEDLYKQLGIESATVPKH